MILSSPVFLNNEAIPRRYTCDGENISPPLQIRDIPSEAASLALIVHDPDAPHGDFVHWVVWNLPTTTAEIAEGKLPDGAITGTNGFGTTQWGGPCPPNGTHRYIFTLYALDTALDLPSTTTRNDLLTALHDNIVTNSTLIGLYRR